MRLWHRLRGLVRGAFWLVRLALVLLIVGALGGAIYQFYAEDRDRENFPPPGQLVDIGGHNLHLSCTGEGTPTVILDAGLGGFWLDWALVQPEVARTSRVCSYDRAGMGWSDPGVWPRNAGQIVTELHTLLARAEVPGPYILVGHSLGGLHARLYASRYPDEVAGLVLVDPTTTATDEEFLAQIPEQNRAEYLRLRPDPPRIAGVQRAVLSAIPHLGLVRLIGWETLRAITPLPELPINDQEAYRAILVRSAYLGTYLDELAAVDTNIAQVRAATVPLTPRPVVLLAHGQPGSFAQNAVWTPFDQLFQPAQRAIQERSAAALSANHRFIVAENSGHYIQFDQPDLVIAAITSVIAEVRQASGAPTGPTTRERSYAARNGAGLSPAQSSLSQSCRLGS